jgi:predicted nucleic acid-binding protein
VVSKGARFVVADSSPLIGLAAAGVFNVLRELFGTVMVTRLVKEEVTRGAELPGASELDDALRSGWIRVAPTPLETWRFAELDAGEASTIALAARHDGALVLMDDLRGRAEAAALGLEVLDVAALLLAAKRAGLVGPLRPLVARLAKRGFTLHEDARSALLRDAGKPDA